MEEFCIKIARDEDLSRMLQEMAFKNGYKWGSTGNKYFQMENLYMVFNGSDDYIITQSNTISKGIKEVSIEEAIRLIRNTLQGLKIGDSVIFIKEDILGWGTKGGLIANDVYTISELSVEGTIRVKEASPNFWVMRDSFRLATQEEINKNKIIKIGDYPTGFSKNRISVGCRTYEVEDVKALYQLMMIFEIASLDFSRDNIKVSRSLLRKMIIQIPE